MSRKKPREFYSETDQLFDKQAFIDAAGCQTKIVEKIREGDGHFALEYGC